MTDTTIYTLTDLVLAQLATIVGFQETPPKPGRVYDAQVPATPTLDDAGVVKPYAVVFPSPGNRTADRYDEDPQQLTWLIQVTCAAGSRRGWSVAVDWVMASLIGWSPYPGDPSVGFLSQVGDTGPVQRTTTPANDVRWWTAPQFTLST